MTMIDSTFVHILYCTIKKYQDIPAIKMKMICNPNILQ